jgi:sulfur-carrier protein
MTIRVQLPSHLRTLVKEHEPVALEVGDGVTLGQALDALEAKYPVLRGTIRHHVTLERRKLVRFFAAGQDLSNDPAETPLPEPVAQGNEPLLIVGAVAGG